MIKLPEGLPPQIEIAKNKLLEKLVLEFCAIKFHTVMCNAIIVP